MYETNNRGIKKNSYEKLKVTVGTREKINLTRSFNQSKDRKQNKNANVKHF